MKREKLNVKTLGELEALLGEQKVREERLELARLFRFLSQGRNPHIVRHLSFDEINPRGFYSSHKGAFNRLHFVLAKYGIDPRGFLEYAISSAGIFTPELVTADMFRRYAERMHLEREYEHICEMYMKTVEFVASEAMRRGVTPKEFLLTEFRTNRVAYDFMAGRLSKYFLVSLRNFPELFEKLDFLNQEELRIIYGALDELRVMVNEAVFKRTGQYPRPLADSESAYKKLSKNNNNQK